MSPSMPASLDRLAGDLRVEALKSRQDQNCERCTYIIWTARAQRFCTKRARWVADHKHLCTQHAVVVLNRMDAR